MKGSADGTDGTAVGERGGGELVEGGRVAEGRVPDCVVTVDAVGPQLHPSKAAAERCVDGDGRFGARGDGGWAHAGGGAGSIRGPVGVRGGPVGEEEEAARLRAPHRTARRAVVFGGEEARLRCAFVRTEQVAAAAIAAALKPQRPDLLDEAAAVALGEVAVGRQTHVEEREELGSVRPGRDRRLHQHAVTCLREGQHAHLAARRAEGRHQRELRVGRVA